MRLFIAIDLPREVINEIKKNQELIKKQSLFTGKFTDPENLHLTLKFLGEIDDEKIDEIKKKLKEIKFSSFDVTLNETGVFSKSFIKIIWVKLNGKGLYVLQKAIDKALFGLFVPEDRFMGHITIARVKHVSHKESLLKYLESINVSKIKFKIDKFFLKSSELKPEGPVYTDIEEYNSSQ